MGAFTSLKKSMLLNAVSSMFTQNLMLSLSPLALKKLRLQLPLKLLERKVVLTFQPFSASYRPLRITKHMFHASLKLPQRLEKSYRPTKKPVFVLMLPVRISNWNILKDFLNNLRLHFQSYCQSHRCKEEWWRIFYQWRWELWNFVRSKWKPIPRSWHFSKFRSYSITPQTHKSVLRYILWWLYQYSSKP